MTKSQELNMIAPRCSFFVTCIIHRVLDFCPGLHEALLTFQTVGPIAMEVQTAMR